MEDELAVIYTAANAVQAHLLRNALADMGIQAHVTNDVLQAAGGDLPLGWTIAPRVLVPREHEVEARRVAEEYDASLAAGRPQSAAEAVAPPAQVAATARCPSCEKPRTAICPFCQTSGSQFRAADALDQAEPADAGPLLLLCPTCDEPFQDAYLRRCEWCGHDFGVGLEAPPVIATLDVEPMNWRVMVAGMAGVAIIGGLLAYFALLL